MNILNHNLFCIKLCLYLRHEFNGFPKYWFNREDQACNLIVIMNDYQGL